MLIKKLFMILKPNNTSDLYLIFMKVNIKSKLNNLLSQNQLKFSSLGAPLFILMIFNLSSFNGLKEIKDNLFSILSINTLATLTLQFLNKYIDISKWAQENPQNKLIFATNNMLIFHLPMLKSFFKKRCMMKSSKSYHLLRQCQM